MKLPEVIAKAFYIAKSGRPGPVLIDITKNAQIQKFEFKGYTPCNHIRSYRPKPIVRHEYIQQAAELINQCQKTIHPVWSGCDIG
jgi:acetolactate synthase-1/2/3 large subunit